MSKLLIDEEPLMVLPKLAKKIGLNEAIVLQQIHYWIKNPKVGVEHSGRKWIRNTFQQWVDDNFPFWSLNTLRRAVDRLRELNLVLVTKSLNKAAYDKTLWYSIDYDELEKYAEPKPTPKMGVGSKGSARRPNAQNGHIDLPKMGTPIPETTQRLQKDIAPNGAPAAEKIKISNELRKYAQSVFQDATGLEPLPDTSKSNKSSNLARWWEPLRSICEIGQADRDYIRALIEGAVKDLSPDYISAPQSILNTIPKIKAKLNGSHKAAQPQYREVYE